MDLFLYILRDGVYLLCLFQAGRTDWLCRRIPNRYVCGLISGWMIFTPFSGDFFRPVFSAFVIAGGILLISGMYQLLTGKKGLGGGDIKLIYAVGLYRGFEKTLWLIFFACFFALLYRLTGKNDGEPFPFGPFLSLAAILQLLLCIST